MSVLIATQKAEDLMLFLFERNRPIQKGQVVTLVGHEREWPKNATGLTGQPLSLVSFGLKECCDACRKQIFHHKVTGVQFDQIFEKPTVSALEKVSSPVVTTAEKVPVLSVLDKIDHLLASIGKRVGYADDSRIAFGRFAYTSKNVFQGQEPRRTLYIDEILFSGGRRCGQNSAPYYAGEEIEKHKVDTFLTYYSAIKPDLDKLNQLSQEIMGLYDKIEIPHV